MEILLEILFEFIFDGSIEIFGNRTVPMPLRILALAVFLLIGGGTVVLLLLIAISLCRNHNMAFGVLIILLDLLMFCSVVYSIRKRIRR